MIQHIYILDLPSLGAFQLYGSTLSTHRLGKPQLTPTDPLTWPPLSRCMTHLERREPELVTAILDSEDAEQEAVHAQQDAAPQKDRELLRTRILDPGHLECEGNGCKRQNAINGRDDLRLEAELVAEASGEVADAALAIARDVRGLADVVEHVSRCEEQDGDQADSGPEIAVLEDWDDVGRCDGNYSDGAQCGCGNLRDFGPVGGAGDGGLGHVGG